MWECAVTAGWEKSLEKQSKTKHPQYPQRKIQGNIFIEEAQENDSRPTQKDPSEWVISTTKITITVAHLNWEAGITVKFCGGLFAQHVWSPMFHPQPQQTNKQNHESVVLLRTPWSNYHEEYFPQDFFWRKSLVNQSSLTSNSTPTLPLPPKC